MGKPPLQAMPKFPRHSCSHDCNHDGGGRMAIMKGVPQLLQCDTLAFQVRCRKFSSLPWMKVWLIATFRVATPRACPQGACRNRDRQRTHEAGCPPPAIDAAKGSHIRARTWKHCSHRQLQVPYCESGSCRPCFAFRFPPDIDAHDDGEDHNQPEAGLLKQPRLPP